MTRPFTILALVAAAALAGCNNEDHTIVAGPGPDDQPMNNVGVTLPPSIQASKAYRCKDNSLIYVDWLSDGTARVKKDRNEIGTTVTLGEGAPLDVVLARLPRVEPEILQEHDVTRGGRRDGGRRRLPHRVCGEGDWALEELAEPLRDRCQ